MEIQELFFLGMKRNLLGLRDPNKSLPVLDLGSGNSPVPGSISLDWPTWDAEHYSLDWGDETVGGIYAFHFFEHITDPRRMLVECARVLEPGCPITICVPWFGTQMAYQDLDHKHFFTLDTWKEWLGNPYYKTRYGDVKLRIGFNAVVGTVDRNLALFTQLIKLEN